VPAHEFEYAVVRVVPRVDRDEFINVGVIVYCHALDFLAARVSLDRPRLVALHPGVEPELDDIGRALEVIQRVCAADAGVGEIASLSPGERFRWLVSPKSTVTQTSPVHGGLCDDPARMLEHLFDRMVRV
jgi:hypothetical protein